MMEVPGVMIANMMMPPSLHVSSLLGHLAKRAARPHDHDTARESTCDLADIARMQEGQRSCAIAGVPVALVLAINRRRGYAEAEPIRG